MLTESIYRISSKRKNKTKSCGIKPNLWRKKKQNKSLNQSTKKV